MKRFIFSLLFLQLISISIYSQKDDLNKYLEAYKTAEFSESQEIIKDYSFGNPPTYTMMDYTSANGIPFITDIENIKGYKAIVNCKLKSEAGTFIDKKMIVVMYLNQKNEKWSVYLFREVCDPEKEYNSSKANIDAGKFYTKKQYVYRNLSYWAIAAGKIKESEKYIALAKQAANSDGDSAFSITSQTNILEQIIGK